MEDQAEVEALDVDDGVDFRGVFQEIDILAERIAKLEAKASD